MTLLLTLIALFACLVVILTTTIQLLYLESLRIRAREIPSLQFFKETLEGKIGLPTERGALSFSLIKHLALGILGSLIFAITSPDASFGEAMAAAVLITSGATIICAYIVPQLIYRKSSGHLLLPLTPFFRLMAISVYPLIWGLEFLQSLFDLGGTQQQHEETRPAEHIEALISAGEEEGLIEEGNRELIQSVVAFNTKTVREVMTPRPRIIAIPQTATLEDLRQLVIVEQFSRIPAYDQDIDSITGFVHVRDMFELDDEHRAKKKVREVLRPIRAIPETKAVNDLLREMKDEGAHMAVVVDEYGATAGIVTLEDMVEEIVGEIHDEHEPDRDVREEGEGSFVISGSFDVSRLDALIGFRPETGTESTTVGGLVQEMIGHVPGVGEVIQQGGVIFEVLASNNLRVDQVRVKKATA
jgi:CBS domain containing-hemolysin-like protein